MLSRQTSEPKPSGFRFSLRTLLLLVALAAVFAATCNEIVRLQRIRQQLETQLNEERQELAALKSRFDAAQRNLNSAKGELTAVTEQLISVNHALETKNAKRPTIIVKPLSPVPAPTGRPLPDGQPATR